MASSDRRASLSPSERQLTKSRSSSRSHRTPPNIIVYEEDEEADTQRTRTSSQASRPSTHEINPVKRSESSTSNRSTTAASPTSNISKKQRPSLKSSPPPIINRKTVSKRKKSSISVSEIEKRQILEPNDLEKQYLAGRGLAVVPAEIFDIVTLRRLILSNNNLSGLPSAIRSLINLEYLDVSHNPLIAKNGHDDYSCFPREFRYLKNLRTLILAECSLKHIPVVIWNALSLQTLDLSRNKVGYIVGDIGNLTEIQHLRLSQMDLDTLPPEIGFCEKLETLDLSGNPIDILPETIVECRLLYELRINYKTFYKLLDTYMLQLIDEGKIRSEHIPQVIFELENLRVLDLNRTKINAIPNEMVLSNLTELYLSNNSFFEIQESICTLPQLKILNMSHNRIFITPDHMSKMKHLEILDLSYNRLTTIAKILARLSALKKLLLSHNLLYTVEKEFTQSQSLVTLDISYNKIPSFPEELCELKQLETLDLRYNKLESLPSSIRRMQGLQTMNTFDDTFQRMGLHLLGNPITDPPGYVWKSTDIQTLHIYIEEKEKTLRNEFHHLKLIFLGPKNIGKTQLATKLVNNRKLVTNTRKTIDMYVSILQERQLQNGQEEKYQQQQQGSRDGTSSAMTDQWIENRISTSGDYLYNRQLKTKRIYPPPIKTYRSMETSDNIIHKATLTTKNNFYFTILDLKSEPSFEILYPLTYDDNALYILPVNLTILLNILQAATSLENLNESEDQSIAIDFNALLTHEWLYYHIFRYFQSVSDHCQRVSIAVLGLLDNAQLTSNHQAQQLLDEIHAKVNAFLVDEGNHRENIVLYSQYFPRPVHLDDEEMSTAVIEQFESLAHQWNIVHLKQKQHFVKKRFAFTERDRLVIDYETYSKCFEEYNGERPNSSEDHESIEERKTVIPEEFSQMSFDECLDYLKLIGDVFCFGQKPHQTILLQPYYLLNKLLSSTLFRSHIDQWLNYDDNMVFRFSGYYPTQKTFDFDRQRLLTRGEFTWSMLNVLFYEQNNSDRSLNEENIFDYCRLMERLYLGYLNQSNLTHHEFTTNYFVCPWLTNETSVDIDYNDYFKTLEQERQYESLRCEQARRIKQQQLWFSMDNEQDNMQKENFLQTNPNLAIVIPELPAMDQIKVDHAKILSENPIQTIRIINEESNPLPSGFYERLLICLHPLFNERLDYSNLTLGRTVEKSLIKIQRFDEQNQIHLTIDGHLFKRIENLLTSTLFCFYPTVNLRIET